jgi:hypothetical protein
LIEVRDPHGLVVQDFVRVQKTSPPTPASKPSGPATVKADDRSELDKYLDQADPTELAGPPVKFTKSGEYTRTCGDGTGAVCLVGTRLRVAAALLAGRPKPCALFICSGVWVMGVRSFMVGGLGGCFRATGGRAPAGRASAGFRYLLWPGRRRFVAEVRRNRPATGRRWRGARVRTLPASWGGRRRYTGRWWRSERRPSRSRRRDRGGALTAGSRVRASD